MNNLCNTYKACVSQVKLIKLILKVRETVIQVSYTKSGQVLLALTFPSGQTFNLSVG